mgnify:CR=1 FL=1
MLQEGQSEFDFVAGLQSTYRETMMDLAAIAQREARAKLAREILTEIEHILPLEHTLSPDVKRVVEAIEQLCYHALLRTP